MDISKVAITSVDPIFDIFQDCRKNLELQNIFQWTDAYPTKEIIAEDIRQGHMYSIVENQIYAGVVSISEIQEDEYSKIKWLSTAGPYLVIHRLAVHPLFQNRGFARLLMDFAENFALDHRYASIRLDAFSDNKRVLRFYENRGYIKCGEVYFPGRVRPFYCYEKEIID